MPSKNFIEDLVRNLFEEDQHNFGWQDAIWEEVPTIIKHRSYYIACGVLDQYRRKLYEPCIN